MWNTMLGTRTLRGNEAKVFRVFAEEMRSRFVMNIISTPFEKLVPLETGVDLFDSFTLGQQVVLTCQVTEGLLDTKTPPQPRTAAHEACIFAIYESIKDLFEEEAENLKAISPVKSYESIRYQQYMEGIKLDMLNAARDLHHKDLPTLESSTVEEWNELAILLVDAVLLNRDFDLANQFAPVRKGIFSPDPLMKHVANPYFDYLPENTKSYQDLFPYWEKLSNSLGVSTEPLKNCSCHP